MLRPTTPRGGNNNISSPSRRSHRRTARGFRTPSRRYVLTSCLGVLLIQIYLVEHFMAAHNVPSPLIHVLSEPALQRELEKEKPPEEQTKLIEPMTPAPTTRSPSPSPTLAPHERPAEEPPRLPKRFILVETLSHGQGLGNAMHGLLAFHVLAKEYDRIVCVSPDWIEFHRAFRSLVNQTECAEIAQDPDPLLPSLTVLNFGLGTTDQCKMQHLLSSNNTVIRMKGNTYPGWSNVPPGLWDEHYEPTEELLGVLPSQPIQTVVHLREPDPTHDFREGLDNATLHALGEELPNDTFLVTNNVNWYKLFEDQYGWRNPGWLKVEHSAKHGIGWGSNDANVSAEDAALQLWSDWYTILKAKHVYHTHSDFSLSAIHWNEIDSKTIQGTNEEGELKLMDEYWRDGHYPPPLVNRTGDQLKDCATLEPKRTTKSGHVTKPRYTHVDSKTVAGSPLARYIIVENHILRGQGLGNLMHGMLAFHVLGKEFNRIVCVSPRWIEFHRAFRSRLNRTDCAEIFARYQVSPKIKLLSYDTHPADQCVIQSMLSSNETVVRMTGNTYPGWSTIPPGLWDEYYEPTEELLGYLPAPPYKTVVHLRAPDPSKDQRKGVDKVTLHALGRNLPNDTLLVTNNVDWYKLFEHHYGWRNPGWRTVKHSAKNVNWGRKDVSVPAEDAALQLWSDWYTILKAEHVYHTHSDFSLSAIHWNEIDSKTIQGVDEQGGVQLTDEYWRDGHNPPPLVNRTGDQLKDCVNPGPKPAKSGPVTKHPTHHGNSGMGTTKSRPRYIMVENHLVSGQGLGNLMHGMLAFHVLGKEYGRIVCVSPEWIDFHRAFRSFVNQTECAQIAANHADSPVLGSWNFGPPADQCKMQNLLASNETVIRMMGNTYPGWSKIPPSLWDEHYRPTEEFLRFLPSRPYETVVHLRAPDRTGDKRQGLDNVTLSALGDKLPTDTLLVTNNVDWYKLFEVNFGWQNPGWLQVGHSARAEHWGSNDANVSTEDAAMQLWSDWYTILKAQHVYHTHSDFSLSAIHWNEIDSKTILGTGANGELYFTDEYWRDGHNPPPLVNRTGDQLRDCRAENEKVDVHVIMQQPRRFIVVQNHLTQQEEGQGVGNLMHGLLAFHLLAKEYNRHVCVSPEWVEFHQGFRSHQNQLECAAILARNPHFPTVSILNFAPNPLNQCELQDLLSSNRTVIGLWGNAYPDWSTIPTGFWDEHYEPTEKLKKLLPRQRYRTVVHLREPDPANGDYRKGLDNVTLNALGQMLPNDTFLVTNNVDRYTFFEENYGWRNPGWVKVDHSVLSATWGNTTASVSAEDATLQLWSDWYAILKAEHVYHTHSDFSLSAIHWNEIDSKTIQGMNASGELLLTDEYWRDGRNPPPLVNRTGDQLEGCPPSSLANAGNATSTPRRYIMVENHLLGSQGLGNVMHGMLAFHVLGNEYNRVVCVSPKWTEFHRAFRSHVNQTECAQIAENYPESPTLISLNYGEDSPADQCEMQQLLSSSKTVIHMIGNTYPGWSKIPLGMWDEHYEPTEELSRFLPSQPYQTVVHLRAPDSRGDIRKGLDNATLNALGGKLPNDTFLVTNNVDWYKLFEEKYGWRNPGWLKVKHSALSEHWGSNDANVSTEDAAMQLWSDWYTILKAEHVYHTHSDFSLSAIHWNEIDSKTILGTDANGELFLTDEYWRDGHNPPPLVNRTGDQVRDCRDIKQQPRRYIVVQNHLTQEEGQGLGNLMHGLLAFHVLAKEYNRHVCVSPYWFEFHQAFRSQNLLECATVLAENPKFPSTSILNFGLNPPNQCRIRDLLSSDRPVVGLRGNTYPGWSTIPPGLWNDHYEPTERLQKFLPQKPYPRTVVHLRAPDDSKIDWRKGLDNVTLHALGNKLPNDTFLVTNNVDWYTVFEEKYGWRNPGWLKVRHSAKQRSNWGRSTANVSTEDATLQLWSDWYTILRAKRVYHTHSDFSLSAIHWNEIDSQTIQGTDEKGELILADEYWRDGHNPPPLVNRTDDQVRDCHPIHPEGKLVKVETPAPKVSVYSEGKLVKVVTPAPKIVSYRVEASMPG